MFILTKNRKCIYVILFLMMLFLMTSSNYAITIAVDDGHGQDIKYKACPDGYLENTFNDKVKNYLIKELKYNDFTVIDCSPETYDTSLTTRVNRANNGNADIFISIHYNAFDNIWQTYASGVETYYHKNSAKGV